MCERLSEWLKREKRFLLISHVSPDGDTIGSCLALYGILSSMGKHVTIICDQPVPKVYRFLPWADKIRLTEDFEEEYANVIAIDCADILRMGNAGSFFNKAKINANIDHHVSRSPAGEYDYRNPDVSATGELVFDLWSDLEKTPGENAKDIAICLFTAISTDTGNFAYNNTTPDTFRIAASLLEYGIDIAAINREVYRTVSYTRTCLKGYVISNIQLFEQGLISYAFLSATDLKRFDATGEDLEGIIDYLRDIDTVEIAILIREARDGTYKVTMRSKKYADVCAVAQTFGGGGHLRAAGCTLSGEWPKNGQLLIEAAKKALV